MIRPILKNLEKLIKQKYDVNLFQAREKKLVLNHFNLKVFSAILIKNL